MTQAIYREARARDVKFVGLEQILFGDLEIS